MNATYTPPLPRMLRDGYRGKICFGTQQVSIRVGYCNRPHSWLARRIVPIMEALAHSDGVRSIKIRNIVVSEKWGKDGVTVSVSGDVVKTTTGRKCGDWERVFHFSMRGIPKYVYNSSFGLNRSQQGKGFARGWLASCFRAYEAMGFREVTVTAGGDNGRYTWAALGFDRKNKTRPIAVYHYTALELAKKIRAAEKKGLLSADTVALALKVMEGRMPRGMTMQEVAQLGRNEEWRDRRRQHIGQAILMEVSNWSGRYDLKKNKSLQTAA